MSNRQKKTKMPKIGDLGYKILSRLAMGELTEDEARELISGKRGIASTLKLLREKFHDRGPGYSRISAAMLQKWQEGRYNHRSSAEYSKAVSDGLKRAWKDPESRFHRRYDGKQGEETRKAQSEGAKRMWRIKKGIE